MMSSELFNPSEIFFEFIHSNINNDTNKLRLNKKNFSNIEDTDLAITQIECRNKFKKKLPHFIFNNKVIFPSLLSGEQATAEPVSEFLNNFIDAGSQILDMTAGLGIDTFSFSRKASEVTSIEIDPLKASILSYNVEALAIDNVKVINSDCSEFIENSQKSFDIIYIDPARRDDNNNKTYNFNDCRPNIISLTPIIRKKCKKLFIKGSPMLDIVQSLRDFHYLKSIRVISLKGECKLIFLEIKGFHDSDNSASERENNEILIEAIDINEKADIISNFSFIIDNPNSLVEKGNSLKPFFNRQDIVEYAGIDDITSGIFLYEPNASLMKLAPWNELIRKYTSLKKLGKSTHIFLSKDLFKDFPGRITVIDKILSKKDRKSMNGYPVNVVSRNFYQSSDEIRKEWKLKEGNEKFLYAVKLSDKPLFILSSKIL